jgi:hypothetical protein
MLYSIELRSHFSFEAANIRDIFFMQEMYKIILHAVVKASQKKYFYGYKLHSFCSAAVQPEARLSIAKPLRIFILFD